MQPLQLDMVLKKASLVREMPAASAVCFCYSQQWTEYLDLQAVPVQTSHQSFASMELTHVDCKLSDHHVG